MDDIDKNILKRLQTNSRITISDLSAEISLSVPAIRERLKKLETSGAIKQYTAILDPAIFNKHLMALIFLRFNSPKLGDKFTSFAHTEKEIKECYYITGDFDYCLKIVTKDTSTLESLLARIKNMPGITKTQTIVMLSTIIDNPSISPD